MTSHLTLCLVLGPQLIREKLNLGFNVFAEHQTPHNSSLEDEPRLLDVFESSFGLYYIDMDDPDLKRQPKLSAHWYSHFLKTKGVSVS
ncbi:beta-glucosidase 11 [Quercus suber]|uniref:Beta-glucosidase 11 n=1 Tax=Quercus suber TaxID=58331 RepID=A0AAW0K7Z8_QUESU